MKRLFTLGFSLLFAAASFAHNGEHDHEFNKNITPYHDALDYQNGLNATHLNRQAAWKNFTSKYPSWGARFSRFTQLPHRAAGKAISFAPGGNDPVAKAKAFLQQELAAYKIPVDELVLTGLNNDGHYINVNFKQVHEGKEILWSRVTIRFTQDLKIVLFGADCYPIVPLLNAAIDASAAIHFAETAINTPILSSEIAPELKLFPLPTDQGAELRPVYQVMVHTQDDATTPGSYKTYVDAINGNILYRQNQVKHFGFKVKADVYPDNLYNTPLTSLPLKNLKVVHSGTTYYTDNTGVATLNANGPWNPTLYLEGKWCKIVTGANGTAVHTLPFTNVVDGDSVTYTQSSPNATERHHTCYYHVNAVHDFMKAKFPSFTGLDISLTTRIDRTDGNCNAFYNGNSINFYTTSNGCNALSNVSSVVYHEYGHGISDKFWTAGGSSFDNGGMGEGYSDVWAMCITKSPIVGQGFNVNQPTSFIRRYDQAPKVYPTNLVGQVHADGEIIAGAWWDVAVNLSSTLGISLSAAIDTMSTIYSESQYGLATGPDGQEGQVYFDILMDALTYDDNNNDITDGTPHFIDIVKGFARHGIYLLADSKIQNTTDAIQVVNTTFPVTCDLNATFPAFVGDMKMFYRKKGTTVVDSLAMTPVTDSTFTVSFPSTTSATVYEFYYTVNDVLGYKSAYAPIESQFGISFSQRNVPYYLAIGYIPKFTQNLENTLTGWTIGDYTGDNATAGKWIVAVPIPSSINGELIQTGSDHTTGTGKCAVTGNATSATAQPGAADIDNGKTSLQTEEIDLSTYTKPVLSYWRWFSNSQSTTSPGRKDRWIVYLQYPTSTVLVERTYQPDVQWRQNLVPLDLSKGNKVRVLFIAEDSVQNGQGTWVEAAVDDIQILDEGSFPASIQNLDEAQCLVYPNPAQDVFHIESSEQGNMHITLLNALGEVVYKDHIAQYSQHVAINTSTLRNGMYFLKVEINGKVSQQKISIKK